MKDANKESDNNVVSSWEVRTPCSLS